MTRKMNGRLSLGRETLRRLTAAQMAWAEGGRNC